MSVPSEPLIEIRPDATDQNLQFFWSPPLSDGGSPITQYILTDGTTTINLSPESRYYRLSGLTNGTTYSFYLIASNANGTSPSANFRSVQPGFIPSPVTNVSTSFAFGSVYRVSWNNSSNLGGNTRLLNTLVTGYPYLSDGITLNTTSTNLMVQRTIVGGTSNVYQECFLTLSTNLTYNVKVECINDPGYSPAVFSGPISTLQNQVISTNLIQWMDAANISSYTGSGSTWSNLITSNSAFTMTLFNTPTISTFVFNGTSNSAFRLDGTSQFIGHTNSMTSFMSNNYNETRELWFYWNGTNSILLDERGQGGGSSGWQDAQIVLSNTSVWFAYWTGSLSFSNVFTGLTSNSWNHLVYQYISSGRVVAYVNGVQTFSNALGTRQFPGSYYLYLGLTDATTVGGITNYFGGGIGIWRMYNQVISAEAVLSNYNTEKGRFGR
jgi:hypothetical protein